VDPQEHALVNPASLRPNQNDLGEQSERRNHCLADCGGLSPDQVVINANCLLDHLEMVQCVLRRKGFSDHAIDHAVTVVYRAAMPYIKGTKICKITNRRAWVFTVAINSAIFAAEREVHRQTVEPAILAETMEDVEPGEDLFEIHDALKQLTEQQSEAVVLYFLREMSLRAAAKQMGIAVGTLRGHLSAAKKHLKEILPPLMRRAGV
jgi:RNA polymerase sigma factor (sigma-70 family)